MHREAAVQRHAEHFPAPFVPVTNAHAEAAWLDGRKTDAKLQFASKTEQFNLHVYCNSGNKEFEEIVDRLSTNHESKLYDANITMEPPRNDRAGWSREIAAELLVSDETKFSFIEGKPDSYGGINALFYAYKNDAKNDGVVVKLRMALITDTSFRIPKEAVKSRR